MLRSARLDVRTFSMGVFLLGAVVAVAASAEEPTDSSNTAPDALSNSGEEVATNNTPHRWAVYWENDGALVLKPWDPSDRHYTNGVGASLTWQSPTAGKFWKDFLGLPAAQGTAAGVVFGQEIYTPTDLLRTVPDALDRPYAGYAYGGLFVQRECNNHLDHLQLNLGVVGPSALARQTQVTIHDTFAGDDPGGWSSQLRDELAAQLTYRHKVRIDLPWLDGSAESGIKAQVIPYGEVNLGTVHRDVAGGATVRWGLNLPDDFGPGRLRDVASFTGTRNGAGHPLGTLDADQWSVYGFARLAGRYVEWDTFLDGSNYRDPSPALSKEPWLGEAELGLSVGWECENNHVEVVYSTTWLTRSFETQRQDDSYASLAVQCTVGF